MAIQRQVIADSTPPSAPTQARPQPSARHPHSTFGCRPNTACRDAHLDELASRLEHALVHGIVKLRALGWAGATEGAPESRLRRCCLELHLAAAGLRRTPLWTLATDGSESLPDYRPLCGDEQLFADIMSDAAAFPDTSGYDEHAELLRSAIWFATDELRELIDPDPAATFANNIVRKTIHCLETDWLPELTDDEIDAAS